MNWIGSVLMGKGGECGCLIVTHAVETACTTSRHSFGVRVCVRTRKAHTTSVIRTDSLIANDLRRRKMQKKMMIDNAKVVLE